MFRWLADFYLWFWFHTEFWLTPVNRRPYTYIFRDWIFTHQWPAFAIFWTITGLLAWAVTCSAWYLPLYSFYFMLVAHLIWGSKWIEGQQEVPTYLG